MKGLLAKARVISPPEPTVADRRSRSAVEHLTVGSAHDGQRLDNYLQGRMRAVPRSLIHRIVRTGQVRVNGGRAKPDQRIVAGDVVRIPPLDFAAGDGPRQGAATAARALPVDAAPVVYEDADLLVVNKPAGLAVHGGSGIEAGLIERLRAARPDADFLELAHRLDRDTSGLLLIGKRRRALLALHRMMADGQMTKRYRAIVKGRWGRETPQQLAFPLERLLTSDGERRVRVSLTGQSAATRVSLVARYASGGLAGLPPFFSQLECQLLTGRTHQIRVHLNHAGFPILGDPKYGDFTLNKELYKLGHKRMFLHAFFIEFSHPISAQKLSLEAPLPAEFVHVAQRFGSA